MIVDLIAALIIFVGSDLLARKVKDGGILWSFLAIMKLCMGLFIIYSVVQIAG